MRDPVWVQRGLDALKATLDVEPVVKQQMIDFLLDEGFWDRSKLSDAAARTKFNACLNPGKPDFFKLSEVWALMKRFRRYDVLFAMCEDMGFERPQKIPTRARRAEIEQQLESLTAQHAEQTAELKRLLEWIDSEEAMEFGQDAPRRIHPAMREDGPRFDLDSPDDGSTPPGAF